MLLLRNAIADAEVFHAVTRRSTLSAPEQIVTQYWRLFDGTFPVDVHRGQGAHAIIRWSRWMVECPWCVSVQHASRVDHRFFCVECGNAAVGGKWLAVEWPANAGDIEQVLLQRPDPRKRSWLLGETLTDLVAENLEHGVAA